MTLGEGRALQVDETSIPGLFDVRLVLHADERGWFKENWQRQAMADAGLPELDVVQHNVAYNARAGVLRGIHAEPWDKYVSVASGAVFIAVVDLRQGDGFGDALTFKVTPERALLIPKGCGNSYQVLADHTVYTYLVTGLWSPESTYPAIHPYDERLAITWPIAAAATTMSAKDAASRPLSALEPLGPNW